MLKRISTIKIIKIFYSSISIVIECIRNLASEKKAQTIIEYLIISALVGIFCLVTMKELGSVLERRVEEIKKQVARNLDLK
ncbi:MAG: hypothetical protein HQK51_16520 [Oligoflexia bacterium]|nr:hypothetical protein [Oligoflexia bacterium]